MSIMIDFSQRALNELLDPALGATVVKIEPHWLHRIRVEVQLSGIKFTNITSAKITSNYLFAHIDPSTVFDLALCVGTFASELGCELNSQVGHLNHTGIPILFDDLYLTQYIVSDIGVGPHQDKDCTNLVVSLVLFGSSTFYICKDKEISSYTTMQLREGDLLIMRANGFFGLNGPIHSVRETKKEPMIQLGLRQNIK